MKSQVSRCFRLQKTWRKIWWEIVTPKEMMFSLSSVVVNWVIIRLSKHSQLDPVSTAGHGSPREGGLLLAWCKWRMSRKGLLIFLGQLCCNRVSLEEFCLCFSKELWLFSFFRGASILPSGKSSSWTTSPGSSAALLAFWHRLQLLALALGSFWHRPFRRPPILGPSDRDLQGTLVWPLSLWLDPLGLQHSDRHFTLISDSSKHWITHPIFK